MSAGRLVEGAVKLICQILGHHRSRRKVVFNPNAQRWQSMCIFCGEVMIRGEDADEWETPYA